MSTSVNKISAISVSGDHITAQGTLLEEWDDNKKDGSVVRMAKIDLGGQTRTGPLVNQTRSK